MCAGILYVLFEPFWDPRLYETSRDCKNTTNSMVIRIRNQRSVNRLHPYKNSISFFNGYQETKKIKTFPLIHFQFLRNRNLLHVGIIIFINFRFRRFCNHRQRRLHRNIQ